MSEDIKREPNENRNRRFELKLGECLKAIEARPLLLRKYERELTILKDAVAKQENGKVKPPVSSMTDALMAVSRYRAREALKTGWVCEFGMSRVVNRFENKIRLIVHDEELTEVLAGLKGGQKLSSRQLAIILVLLHNTPKTTVHRFLSEVYD
ncbi:MAG: hypothetical protein IKK83_07160 [Clostridia bacterium]|nr:hypothetical protein [Clostridia bacterium]MBR6594947.1 hypothetical protein [Clostridia bacterium]